MLKYLLETNLIDPNCISKARGNFHILENQLMSDDQVFERVELLLSHGF